MEKTKISAAHLMHLRCTSRRPSWAVKPYISVSCAVCTMPDTQFLNAHISLGRRCIPCGTDASLSCMPAKSQRTLSLRIPEQLFLDLETLANRLEVSRSALARELLARAVRDDGRSMVTTIDELRADLLTVFETLVLSFTDATRDQVRELVSSRLSSLDGH